MQVQLQMFVTELDTCDFVVWTEHGVLSVSIQYDASFIKTALEMIEIFWVHHVLPFMIKKLNIGNVQKGKGGSLFV